MRSIAEMWMRSSLVLMRSSRVWMRYIAVLWMRSSRVVDEI